MKLWVDANNPAPNDEYFWVQTVDGAKKAVQFREDIKKPLTLIDVEGSAREDTSEINNYTHLLEWLEETNRNYLINIHSANPVGIASMRHIIERDDWKEMK